MAAHNALRRNVFGGWVTRSQGPVAPRYGQRGNGGPTALLPHHPIVTVEALAPRSSHTSVELERRYT